MDKLPVEQRDRDAAAGFIRNYWKGIGNTQSSMQNLADGIQYHNYNGGAFTEAFARHRIEATTQLERNLARAVELLVKARDELEGYEMDLTGEKYNNLEMNNFLATLPDTPVQATTGKFPVVQEGTFNDGVEAAAVTVKALEAPDDSSVGPDYYLGFSEAQDAADVAIRALKRPVGGEG